MRTVAIINQKGGSGKTTTAINLAAALAKRDQRTLLVDMDPQSHCALGFAIPEEQLDLQIGDAMLLPSERPIDAARLIWRVARNLDLAPSSSKLAGLEAARGGLADRDDRDLRLGGVLRRFADQYDWCLIDCPPSIGLLTFNALRAASRVLIPVETAFFALAGAEKQIATIKALARRMGVMTPYHILPTMHDTGANLAEDILSQIRKRMADCVLPVVIRADRALKEAASLGMPVIEHAPDAPGSADYAELADWFIAHADEPSATHELFSAADSLSSIAPALEVTADLADARQPVGSRAAELAARARRLAQRSHELNAKLDADPDVSRVMRELDPPAQPAADPKLTADRHGYLFGVRQTSKGVLFVQPAGPQSRLFIAGDHNAWSPTATPMRYNPQLGVHEACVPIPPGRFRYRVVIDGRWIADPHNPLVERNPFGDDDSIILVGDPTGAAYFSAAG